MSTTITKDALAAYEAQIKVLSPKWRERMEQLQHSVRDQVAFGANLGALLHVVAKERRDDFWEWLRAMDPDVRREHIEIARKAYVFKQKNPELKDVSQLTFALSSGESSPTPAAAPDQSRAVSAYAMVTNLGMRLVARLNERMAHAPVQEWDPAVKRSLKDLLRPIVEVYQRL